MFIRTTDGVYDLESKEVSSWEYIDNDTAINKYGIDCAFYTIYYFDENKGHYSECDGKGGHSCVFIEEKDILNQSENLNDLCEEFVMTHYFKETDYTYRKVLNEDKDLMIKSVRLKKINNKNKAIKNEFNIYGCIWIEIKLPNNKSVFRLEPVVIMNDDGVFELI